MEKISIRPSSQEITVRNNEPGIHFDAFSYEGSNLQEKNLGSLFVIGHVKYGEENLGYLVNLISSLAKREYYAGAFTQDQTPKSAFENTLKKLNEVLDDFFKNKQFKLSVGLASIAGENLLISRIGNIKVSLARNGDYIDVLNNIELFDKEHVTEKKFSNVISGKIQPNDKLFLYLPIKTVASREKTLRELFKKEGQQVFAQKLNDLSKTVANFACCGIHVEINSVKEIPIQSRPSYYAPSAPNSTVSQLASKTASSGHPITPTLQSEPRLAMSGLKLEPKTDDDEEDEIDTRKDLKGYKGLPQPHIIPADVSLVRRKNVVASLTSFLGNVNPGPFIKRGRGKSKMIIGILVGLIIVVGGIYFLFIRSGDSASVRQAKANLKIAQQEVSKNDYKSARSLIESSLSNITADQSKSAGAVKDSLNKLLDSIDKVSDKTPTLLWDLSKNPGKKFNNLLATSEGLFVLDADGNFNSIDSSGNLKSLAKISITSANMVFDGSKDALLLNNDAKGAIINKTTGKNSAYSLDGTTEITNGAIYQDNLYTLENNSIIKYADAALGKSKGSSWSSDKFDNALSIAADGNIYILNNDGKLLVYFTGQKKNEFDLGFAPANTNVSIFTHKDLPFIYLINKNSERIMVFDKTDGSLKTTYSLANVGIVTDISITKDQTISILSSDGKIWQIK